jgi:predicted nucleic acid-binding protein
MHRTTILLPESLRRAAKREAWGMGISLGELFRRRLSDGGNPSGESERPAFFRRKPWTSLGPSAPAANHDHDLYGEWKGVFVDTGAFIARELANDQRHAVAVRGWSDLEKPGVRSFWSAHVFDETLALLVRRSTSARAAQWGRDALDAGIEWLRAEQADWYAGLRLMEKLAGQGVSFTDCFSLVLMKRRGLRQVFGVDRHFATARFRRWALANPWQCKFR